MSHHRPSSDWRVAAAAINPALARFPASVGTACELSMRGKYADAENVLLDLLAARGELPDALREYASLLQRQGRNADSAAMRRRLHASEVAALGLSGPEAEATLKFRCAVDGLDPAPAAAPLEYVASHFDAYAATFDEHLVGTLGYSAPGRIAIALKAAGALAGRPSVLDLGCGTGLMGAALAGQVRRLVGCDLSAGMVERARARGLYDELAVGDILEFLARTAQKFDAITCAEVFPYFGDLAPVIDAIGNAVEPGGWFALSAERGEGEDSRLTPDGRYRHSADYLRKLADRGGWIIVSHEECELRRQRGEPVLGHIMVWRK